MKRGAVYLLSQDNGPPRRSEEVDGQDQAQRFLRPVVVVSRDAINRHSAVVLVCPLVDLVGVRKSYPSDIQVRAPEGGLTVDSIVMTGQLRAVARVQLVRHLGDLSAEVMREIERALRITLDLE